MDNKKISGSDNEQLPVDDGASQSGSSSQLLWREEPTFADILSENTKDDKEVAFLISVIQTFPRHLSRSMLSALISSLDSRQMEMLREQATLHLIKWGQERD